jgi:hypothetical protein
MPIVDMSTAIWHLAQAGNLISVKRADGYGTIFLARSCADDRRFTSISVDFVGGAGRGPAGIPGGVINEPPFQSAARWP